MKAATRFWDRNKLAIVLVALGALLLYMDQASAGTWVLLGGIGAALYRPVWRFMRGGRRGTRS